tara:strand:+ start:4174 stop:6282 length:2109 start_codon:yes stop_codon:yes gene_type:complete
MKGNLFTKILYLVALLPVQSVWAQNDTTQKEQPFDISLSELTDFDITVASKNPENIQDAPGVITAYSSKEMNYLGYYTIRDLADITPGYSSYRSLGEITLETRGQKTAGFDNNKHLLLIDGIPIYHARGGKVNVEEDLPLYFAKQVEFLRGPGTALYGVGAFYGVINIASKQANANRLPKVESNIALGFPDFRRRMFTNAIVPHKNGVFSFNLGVSAKNASFTYLGGTPNSRGTNVNRDNVKATFIRINHEFDKGKIRGFNLGIITNYKKGGLGEYWNGYQNPTHDITELTWEQVIPYIKYENQLTDQITLNSYVLGNFSSENSVTGNGTIPSDSVLMSLYNAQVYDFEMLGETKYTPKRFNQRLNFRFGLNYVSRYQTGEPYSYAHSININDPTYFVKDTITFSQRSDSYHIYSAYSQLQYKFNKVLAGMHVTLGARYDGVNIIDAETRKQVDYFEQLSPRIAIVQKLTSNWTIKGLYGKALRAPLLKIRELNLESQGKKPAYADQINTELKPASIQSMEFSLSYGKPRFSGTITYFSNKTIDDITKVYVGNVGNVFTNSLSTITAQGTETELSWTPKNEIFNLKANWSFAVPKSSDSVQVVDVPIHKINGILYLNLNKKITFGLVHHIITGYRSMHQGDYPGYHSTDLNIRYFIDSQFTLELLTRNLFNTTYYYPLFDGSGKASVQGDQRSLLLSINFTL